MGQTCSGQKVEHSKDSALSADVTDEDLAILKQQQEQHQQQKPHSDFNNTFQNQSTASSLTALQQQTGGTLSISTTTASSAKEKERLKALQQEQERLDMIVAAAGRGMISVRSTRGSTGYYDQGFAAALAQHLEQTTSFPSSLPVALPLAPNENSANQEAFKGGSREGDQITKLSTSSSNSVYARLAKPQWEDIALGPGGGLAGCGGENPSQYMDNVAESLLDTVLPTKQHIFASVKPMVENLL
jgi:hypothetical protein